MKDVITSIFGSYVPNTYILDDGTIVIPDGLSGVDIPYVLGVLGFFLCLYCVFRLIGTLLNR